MVDKVNAKTSGYEAGAAEDAAGPAGEGSLGGHLVQHAGAPEKKVHWTPLPEATTASYTAGDTSPAPKVAIPPRPVDQTFHLMPRHVQRQAILPEYEPSPERRIALAGEQGGSLLRQLTLSAPLSTTVNTSRQLIQLASLPFRNIQTLRLVGLPPSALKHAPKAVYRLEMTPDVHRKRAFAQRLRDGPRLRFHSDPPDTEKRSIAVLELAFYEPDMNQLAHIDGLHSLALSGMRLNLPDMVGHLARLPRITDLRLSNVMLGKNVNGQLRYDKCSPSEIRTNFAALAKLDHIKSLTITGSGGKAVHAWSATRAWDVYACAQQSVLTLEHVMPLLAGEQESLDLSHNKIAFDLSNIPALGPNLKALNLTGNPIAPQAIAELVRRYPHVVFDHDTLRVHPAISSRLSST